MIDDLAYGKLKALIADLRNLANENRKLRDMKNPDFTSGCIWGYDSSAEKLEKLVEELRADNPPECICNGGDQGDGLCAIPHEPHCPLYQTPITRERATEGKPPITGERAMLAETPKGE